MELINRTALVTGAGKRIGREIALELARAGMNLVVHYNTSEREAKETVREIERIGRQATLVQGDLSRATKTAEQLFQELDEQSITVDVLVNSAAIFVDASLIETEESLYDSHLDINLKAPFFLSREFARRVAPDSRGAIVNLIDWRAERPTETHVAYNISKAGLLAMTRTLAQQLGPNIRVNGIAPGPIVPPPGLDERYFDDIVPHLPLKMHGEPTDISNATLFLLNSDFLTGEMLRVTGGQHL